MQLDRALRAVFAGAVATVAFVALAGLSTTAPPVRGGSDVVRADIPSSTDTSHNARTQHTVDRIATPVDHRGP